MTKAERQEARAAKRERIRQMVEEIRAKQLKPVEEEERSLDGVVGLDQTTPSKSRTGGL
jgi:hypothetical protein